jgi:hypothetical protein
LLASAALAQPGATAGSISQGSDVITNFTANDTVQLAGRGDVAWPTIAGYGETLGPTEQLKRLLI